MAAILLFLAIGPASAQNPPTGSTTATAATTAEQEAALTQQLLNSAPGRVWVLHAGDSTSSTPNTSGSVIAAFGELGSGSLADAENTAKTFVRTYGRLFGLPPGEPLTGDVKKFREWPRTGTDDQGKFLQYCAGIDNPMGSRPFFYLPSMVTFAFKPDGKLVAVMGYYKPIGPNRQNPGPPERAVQFAIERIQETFPETRGTVSGNGELAVYFTDGEDVNTGDQFVRVVYVVGLTVGSPPTAKRAIIAENLGDGQPASLIVEDARQLENSCDVFEYDPGTSFATVNRDLVDLVYPGFWPDWTVNGTHFKVDPRIDPGVARASDWNGWWDEEPQKPTDPNPKFGELHVYYHLTQARTKALGFGATKDLEKHDPLLFNHWYIPRCSGHASGSAARHNCEQTYTNNAWFNPFDTTLNFASQNVTYSNKYPAYDGTVIYHEYGHFLHKMMSEHWKQGSFNRAHQADATSIGEGFADVFAASCTGQTKIGGYYLGAFHPPGSAAEDKSRNVDTVITMTEAATRRLSPHDASQVFSSACWKLRKDGVLPGDQLIRTMITGLRMALLPQDFQRASMAVIAADQVLASSPNTERIGARFNAQQLLPPLRKAGP